MERPRSDGRASENTLRPLSCELGTLKNCDGSAVWKSGHTSVLAGVHGPISPRQAQHEGADAAAVSVVIKSGTIADASGSSSGGIGGSAEYENFVTKQLAACILTERYPRTVISIVLQVLGGDGSVLAALLHAAVSALMDAGVEMKVLPVAVTCSCRVGGTRELRLDPTWEEEQASQGVLVFVFADQALLGFQSTGCLRLSATDVLTCSATALRAVPAVKVFWRLAIEQKTIRESQTLWSS
jgi:ribonuclease PH